jgi:hypothetical protein
MAVYGEEEGVNREGFPPTEAVILGAAGVKIDVA